MARYVITGALGAGKTSVLALLAEQYETVAEPARVLIAEHRDATGESTLDHRPGLFLERLIARSIEDHSSSADSTVTVFDRGVPDCAAYAAAYELDTGSALDAADRYRYDDPVFVAPPWEEIYSTDTMRRATFAQAEAFYGHVTKTYAQLGYDLVELPKASVGERAELITGHIEAGT